MSQPNKLVVVWTNGDKEVAIRMAFMYTLNSKLKEWWSEVSLIVWGPSSKLLAEDTTLQEYIRKIKDAGVELLACKACADSYGVSEELESLEVTYLGIRKLPQLIARRDPAGVAVFLNNYVWSEGDLHFQS